MYIFLIAERILQWRKYVQDFGIHFYSSKEGTFDIALKLFVVLTLLMEIN